MPRRRTKPGIFIGTDCGGTTSKSGGVWADGTPISKDLLQSPTNSDKGKAVVVQGWVEGVDRFLAANKLSWDQVRGVGLAIPGPFNSNGVMGKSANLPADFEGWDFHTAYSAALAKRAGRPLPLACANDANAAGVGEAAVARGGNKAAMLMLAPGSGLGAAYIDAAGFALDGDTFAGMESGHMPAPLHLMGGIRPFKCGCQRDWGCVEAYTAIAGLPQLLAEFLPRHPGHPLSKSTAPIKKQVLSLRDLAQEGDKLALEIFDFQARALGLHIGNLLMSVDATYVVIGGGLIDPEATTPAFRKRYMQGIEAAAQPYLFPMQKRQVTFVEASLGELSQCIGAGLLALYNAKAAGAPPASKL